MTDSLFQQEFIQNLCPWHTLPRRTNSAHPGTKCCCCLLSAWAEILKTGHPALAATIPHSRASKDADSQDAHPPRSPLACQPTGRVQGAYSASLALLLLLHVPSREAEMLLVPKLQHVFLLCRPCRESNRIWQIYANLEIPHLCAVHFVEFYRIF